MAVAVEIERARREHALAGGGLARVVGARVLVVAHDLDRGRALVGDARDRVALVLEARAVLGLAALLGRLGLGVGVAGVGQDELGARAAAGAGERREEGAEQGGGEQDDDGPRGRRGVGAVDDHRQAPMSGTSVGEHT